MGGGRCWQKEEGGEAEAGAEVGLASGKATTHMGEAGASHAVGKGGGRREGYLEAPKYPLAPASH